MYPSLPTTYHTLQHRDVPVVPPTPPRDDNHGTIDSGNCSLNTNELSTERTCDKNEVILEKSQIEQEDDFDVEPNESFDLGGYTGTEYLLEPISKSFSSCRS